MAYITGSLTDANPGPALHTLMATALTTAGFTLVDTVTISTRTHKVWKSPAAGNAANLDWYLDIGYTTTGAGTIALVTFEMFDPATDLGYRGAYNTNSTLLTANGSPYGTTGHALETNWFHANTAGTQTSLSTTAFGYWVSITADRVLLLCSTAPSAVMYAGLYDPDPTYAAKAGASLFPLFTGKVGGSGVAVTAGLTRIPPWASFTVGSWAYTADTTVATAGGAWSVAAYPLLPTGAQTSYPFTAVPIPIMTGTNFPGGRWGWLRDVFAVSSAGVTRGDTCTINGASHVLGTTASGFSYAMKAS